MKIQVGVIIVFVFGMVCVCSNQTSVRHTGFEEKFYWDYPDFEFPSGTKKVALSSGSYIPRNNVIWAVNVWRDRVFVSIFRYHIGILSSLNYFSIYSKPKSPRLIPYPSFEDNYVNEDPKNLTVTLPSSSSVISTAYFQIDKCNRLWVTDNGHTDYYGNPRIIAPPALLIFDLISDTLIRRISITPQFLNPGSGFYNLAIDINDNNCEDAFAYLPDSLRSVIVYSFRSNRMWQVLHNYFGADPHEGNFFYEHLNFQWNFGVYGMVVGDKCSDGSKRVYFNPLASTELFWVSNRVLQNETHILLNKYFYDVHYVGDRGKRGQVIKLEYDPKTRVLFNTLVQRNSIGCWNTVRSFKRSNQGLIYQKTHYFPGDVTIDHNRNLWMLSNKLPINLYDLDNRTRNIKNMQIFVQSVNNAIAETVCEG